MQEKRSYPRVPLAVTATCLRKDGETFTAETKDISIGGMFLESAAAVSFGAEVTITLRLPGAKQDVKLPGIVRWVKPGGFGVQFGLLGALETHLISQLMRG